MSMTNINMYNTTTANKYDEPNTIDALIALGDSDNANYNNTSFSTEYGGILYNLYNVTSDYMKIIRRQCKKITLSNEEYLRYKYRPKLLCHDIYGVGEYYYIIMLINDICSVKDFTMRNIMIPTKNDMNTIIKGIYNNNKGVIDAFADSKV